MKTLLALLVLSSLTLSGSAFAKKSAAPKRAKPAKGQGEFFCDITPGGKLGTYYCISGLFTSAQDLMEVSFGTCQSKTKYGGAEPVKTVIFKTLSHDPKLAAASKDFAQASAFDVSSKEFGPSTLFIPKDAFDGTSSAPFVQVQSGAPGAEIRMKVSCPVFKKP